MNVAIFGSQHQIEKLNLIKRLFEKLTQLEANIFVDENFHSFLVQQLQYTPDIDGILTNKNKPDIAISVGGDGTFLRTVERISRLNIPIVGINTGRLGFLADISSHEIEDTLDEIFKNYFKIEERTLLHIQTPQQEFGENSLALNEVAILKRDTSSMITIHTELNDEYLTSYQADGLVIATPTGSTAYSMSVNGPIIVPQSNSFVLSPVAPHSLNVRPLIIPDTTTITFSVESRNDTFLISLDGRSKVFPTATKFTVTKSPITVKVIKRHHHTFYQTLREKLMWGADKRSK